MSRWRKLAAASGAIVLMLSPSCGGVGFDSINDIKTLRIIHVSADPPYAQPGQQVTMRMTVHDALEDEPRPIQVSWVTGCADGGNGQFRDCIDTLPASFADLDPAELSGLFKQEVVDPERSGVPNAAEFTFTVPQNALDRTARAESGARFASVFVFFAACAGRLTFGAPSGEVAFPFDCVDDDGERLGADSFVPGVTQLFVFDDGRTNANPEIERFVFEGAPVSDGLLEAPVVDSCVKQAPADGCGAEESEPADECPSYQLGVVVGDGAEPDPESVGSSGEPLTETVWVRYFADGGSFDRSSQLVSSPLRGYLPDHTVAWTPPEEPGLYRIWAIAHDARAGAAVEMRRVFVR
jgi:hypothetical protein